MLRRTFARANKAPATPGPTLYGWGRKEQKRRLGYESVENKYHRKQFNKNWDLAGQQLRTTDYQEVRTYFAFSARWGLFTINHLSQTIGVAIGPLGGIYLIHRSVMAYDDRLRRRAWW